MRKITYFGTGRYWRVRLGSTFIVIIHTYSRQEIYSCIIHYSDSEERQKRALFFLSYMETSMVHLSSSEKKVKQKDQVKNKGNKWWWPCQRTTGVKITLIINSSWKEGRLLCLFILCSYTFVNGEHCFFRILQYLSLYTCGLATLHYSCTSHTNMRARQLLGLVAARVLPLVPNAALTLPYKPYGKRLNSTKKLKQIAKSIIRIFLSITNNIQLHKTI